MTYLNVQGILTLIFGILADFFGDKDSWYLMQREWFINNTHSECAVLGLLAVAVLRDVYSIHRNLHLIVSSRHRSEEGRS